MGVMKRSCYAGYVRKTGNIDTGMVFPKRHTFLNRGSTEKVRFVRMSPDRLLELYLGYHYTKWVISTHGRASRRAYLRARLKHRPRSTLHGLALWLEDLATL